MALSAPGLAEFGEGSDHIWLAEVNCTGTEAALSEYRASPWGGENCTHGEDASVDCSDLTISEHTQLRLVNSPSHCAGRVEVLHDQQWGAVCDHSWDINDAKVMCRQLACGAVSVPDKAWFGEGSHPIWLDKINCTGTEASLTSAGLDFGETITAPMKKMPVLCAQGPVPRASEGMIRTG
ncbi:unnamed protein product, partial [Eretmochelys imbricata]